MAIYKSGLETRVNMRTADIQSEPTVATLADGGWIVTWQSNGQDTDGYGIYQKRFDHNGNAVSTADRLVNVTTADSQYDPNVTALADGGWVVTWESLGQDGSSYGIYQQRFDQNGDALYQADRIVNVTTTGSQTNPSVTALTDGGWVVTWESNGQDGSGTGIYQQRFDRDGNAASAADRLVNVTTTGSQLNTSVTGLAGGGWAVTWKSSDDQIYMQAFDRNGVASSTIDVLINTTLGGSKDFPRVTALPDGSWIVTWSSNQDGDFNIYQQRFLPEKAPHDLTLSGSTVQEGATSGTPVGTVVGQDANLNYGDQLTYTLLDDADGRFKLMGDKILVENGLRLDYEQAAIHTIKVQVADRAGNTLVKDFAITVTDIPDTSPPPPPNLVLRGTSGANTLTGQAGHDTLYGGAGKDVLTGGSGQDVFVFDTRPNKRTNLDTITDFNATDDTIWLDNKYLKKLGSGSASKPAKLKAAFFKVADKAKDGNDYLVYNKKTGVLYYDEDGSGAKAAVAIAKLANKASLTKNDFFVI
ncbi:M10 family metallopeptidase C-terminal domain-containing protein [Microvirga subterranea]|uniref:Cadherin domain-containing protein n=1 Tax=Microvirga subterranea TaxID=186651 RepID=A0A370HUU5_9HYPH|nr:hypothetical protein [Microvirga subterranea]RDI62289.1 hypothetical protein DES45_101557 [Microvirga subterranea]